MHHGKLVILCGPSGTGKKTVWSSVIKNPKYHLKFSISFTTRKKRIGEIHGQDYYFVSKSVFMSNVENNQFLEWAKYIDNYYGTPKNFVLKELGKGWNVFLEIEMQGVKQILKNCKDRKKLLLIFLIPPNLQELKTRLINRHTESSSIIEQRLNQATWEIRQKNIFDYVILNKTIAQAQKELTTILDKELLFS